MAGPFYGHFPKGEGNYPGRGTWLLLAPASMGFLFLLYVQPTQHFPANQFTKVIVQMSQCLPMGVMVSFRIALPDGKLGIEEKGGERGESQTSSSPEFLHWQHKMKWLQTIFDTRSSKVFQNRLSIRQLK